MKFCTVIAQQSVEIIRINQIKIPDNHSVFDILLQCLAKISSTVNLEKVHSL